MRSVPRAPVWIPEGSAPLFPDPQEFDEHGLIAGGGDLSAERLIAAYAAGIFPWYDEPPILWWSPNPRAVINPDTLHVSRSLGRALRRTAWRVTAGTALDSVMRHCADRPEGTWLSEEMQHAYRDLGQRGCALSYEVWEEDQLVGGLYGVLIGGLFAAESKFHLKTNASKIALVSAVTDLFGRGVQLFDVQFVTDHLRSLGVHEVSRSEYLRGLEAAISQPVPPGPPGENLLPGVLYALGLD